MKKGDKITLYSRNAAKNLERGDEVHEDGQRFYQMIDTNNRGAKPALYVADNLDQLAAFSRAEIRRDKYSSRGFQKTRRKRGK